MLIHPLNREGKCGIPVPFFWSFMSTNLSECQFSEQYRCALTITGTEE